MDIKKYFERLNLDPMLIPNLQSLKKIHEHHLLNIPFENLDIHYNNSIVLDFDLLENKILGMKRGGFCYELNGLFYKLLSELGYNVKMINARVYDKYGNPGTEYDHMALIVKIDDSEFLADVGFGDNFVEPLKFSPDIIQGDKAGLFKIVDEGNSIYKLCSSEDGQVFKDLYLFSDREEKLKNFEEMCLYHQTSSESHFTQKRVCSMLTPEGRITLSDLKLIKTSNGVRTENILRNEEEFKKTLKGLFGVVIK